MVNNTNGTTIKVDTHDLELTIDSLKSAVTEAIKGINTSANNKQSGFETALQNLVERSLEVSSNGLRAFHQKSLTTMNGEVLKYQKIINGTLTNIERSKLVTQTEEHGIDFERRNKTVRESQNQLISEQKQAFTDFKTALKQVASRLLTVSGMFNTANELQDRKNHADFINSPFKDLSTFITLGKTVKGAEETYLRDAYDKMFELFQQRHTKDFDKNELIKLLAQQKGQERLVSNLKAADDPMTFIKLFMQAMSQGKDNSNISDRIQKDITKDNATYTVLTDKEVLKYLPWAEQNASHVNQSLPGVLGAGVNNNIRKADDAATKAAATDQSAPVLNTWNNLLSHVMEQFPDTSKTVYSLAALGSALDDTAKTAVQLGGGLLLFKGSLKGLGLIPEAAAGSGLAARAAGLTPYAVPVVASYLAATTAANTTAKNVNGTLGGVVAPKALTDAEKTEWEKNREQRIEEDSKRNAPYMPTVTQNMNGQALVFDRKANEYKFVDPKTHKETWMGIHSPNMKHAYDEWVANSQKRQEFQDQTGTKIIMRPRGRGLLSSSGTIEYIVVDADGKEVANFGNKLNLSKKDMVNKVSTYYNHNQKQIPESRLPIIDVSTARSSPVFSKNIANNKPNIPSNIDQIRNQNQIKSQVLNQSSSVKNDQHFNFNIHLTALTNDLSPLKQWFKREFPAIANSVHAPVTLHPHFMQDMKTGK